MGDIFILQKQLLLVSNEDPIITRYITPPAFCGVWSQVPLVSSTSVNTSRIGPSSDVRANKCNDKPLSSESPSKCCILGGQIFRPHSAIVLATFRILPQHFLAPARSLPPLGQSSIVGSSTDICCRRRNRTKTSKPLRSLAALLPSAFLSHFLNVIKAIRRPSSTF